MVKVVAKVIDNTQPEIDEVIERVLFETLESAKISLEKEFPGWKIEKVEGDDTAYRIFNPSTIEAAVIRTKD